MSLREPVFQNEAEEADRLYDHRDLIDAEGLIDAAAGRLMQLDKNGQSKYVEPFNIPQQDLDDARQILMNSGIWTENTTNPNVDRIAYTAELRKAS